MSLKTVFFFIILISLPALPTFGQGLCYNENMQPIDKKVYVEKCKSSVFRCFTENMDSLVAHRMEPRFVFGKISSNDFQQIRKLLISRNNISIDENATLLISYRDTLIGYDHKYKDIIAFNKKADSINKTQNEKSFIKKKYLPNRADYGEGHSKGIELTEKCISNVEKKLNAKVLHTYQFDKDYLRDYPNTWCVKDANVVKKTLFNGTYKSNNLIIKPDGEFLLGAGNLAIRELTRLIKNPDWSQHKRHLRKSLEKPYSKAKGIFAYHYKYHNFCY